MSGAGRGFEGAITALVTPFTDGGRIDETALARLVERQVEAGIHGLAPCGTTGEGAVLAEEEQALVVRTVVRHAAGRVPVIAGCGSNDTRRTVDAARRARDAGADGLLVVTPYYNKPNRSGMRAHFEAVAGASELPIVLYNVPGRTGQNLDAAWTLELASIAGIVSVKEASADLDQIAGVIASRRPGFTVLSGDDALALPTMALGADGIISVVANAAPGEMARLIEACREGRFDRARELHYRLLPLMRANFVESNPVPVKTSLAMLGLCGETLRPPLGPPAEPTRQRLREALERAGLSPAAR